MKDKDDKPINNQIYLDILKRNTWKCPKCGHEVHASYKSLIFGRIKLHKEKLCSHKGVSNERH